jgi:hypothetical protein
MTDSEKRTQLRLNIMRRARVAEQLTHEIRSYIVTDEVAPRRLFTELMDQAETAAMEYHEMERLRR